MTLQIKCEECGADLAFKPGTKSLTCNYCDHTMAFAEPESANQAHNELNLDDYINHFDEKAQQVEKRVLDCKSCGAETQLDTNQQSSSCPFCDTPLIQQQAETRKLIKPRGILPFKIERKVARQSFKNWLSKLWFAPNDLKKQLTQHDKFKGIYLPFWTYDCDTNSYYVGQRGEYYYVTVSGTDDDGSPTDKKERRTRWSNTNGKVHNFFDDMLVSATKSLPNDKLKALEPWDLKQLVDYKDEYLSGYLAETYHVSLKSGYEIAKKTMETKIRKDVKHNIGGDDQRIISIDTRYNEATFKHILLPVWISAYRYKTKLYQILVNAQTGEVQGMRPYSWVKIALTSLTSLSIILGLVYFYMNIPDK